MSAIKKICALVLCLFLQACATVSSIDKPHSQAHGGALAEEAGLLESVTVGNDDKKIKELLNYYVKLPAKNRIAILKLSKDSYWRYYSNDFNQINDSLVNEFIKRLRSSSRVYDASFLPAMLVPEKRTIPVLREAAARFQADLLLAYRSSCQSYQKYRFIRADETKSYCSVESVLLDTRSGVIVKSIVSREDFFTSKASGDMSFSETVKKAELEATAKALGNVAKEVVAYLRNVPKF